MNKDNVIYGLLIFVICLLMYKLHTISKITEEQIVEIEQFDETEGMYTKLYYDQTIESLKKENKELYDSLKAYKDEIDYLVQFNYEKEYSTGKVEIEKNDTVKEEVKTFEYSNEPNDTLKYDLKIGSITEPSWYSIDFKLSDKFTIVNKKMEDTNKIEISTDNKGMINNTTVLRKKEKYNFLDNIALGPSITCGYDFAKKEPEFIVGVAITYDITHLFKKKK